MTEALSSVKVVVHGRVQGVFFRASTAEQAALHGVVGWVRNLPDGTVEACFEGPHDSVEILTAWCEKGPRHAQVHRVVAEKQEVSGYSRFEIRQ